MPSISFKAQTFSPTELCGYCTDNIANQDGTKNGDLVKVKPCGHYLHKECFNEMNGQLKHIRDTSDTGKLTEIASEGKCATCSQRFNSISTMYSLRK